ncbi:MAG TPA: GIY-YIG nuclease [Parvularcula sp.]|nr:GIY-YIG nuclease [Parvularcula sp.]HBS31444.1 GIY-YIG nuclease [Parvularcula sp.]HBS34472.1 GIY-YIG nuclease [Parvularcula sp.]
MRGPFYVYILASRKNGTIYIGVTNDLRRRTHEHREGIGASFTKKYDVTKLVYFEAFDRISVAIDREKELKKWRRAWKIALIERDNADWKDLYFGLGLA